MRIDGLFMMFHDFSLKIDQHLKNPKSKELVKAVVGAVTPFHFPGLIDHLTWREGWMVKPPQVDLEILSQHIKKFWYLSNKESSWKSSMTFTKEGNADAAC